ncbi:hypothetical protein ACT17_15440 [Mycolicibacterium conceptionense]|uniref:Transmembrane protein n=1 Tax=Mycolicibacterium conceptionense TaxID=451644 RepID=A0A0J8UBD1_9MYCO|nr:hypothetical protein [Mycolicibacterium conceptionense]KMV17660.1 hypothetical protein ACT17_15440 [Mycolicibacterium conceptionense]
MASFLDLFTAKDSDGASAASYKVHFSGSSWSNQDSWVFGMATALIYTIFKVIAVIANSLLGFVLSSGSWLQPLSDFYQKVTQPFFDVVPPWAIACLGAAIVAVSVWRSKPKSTSGELFASESLNRIGTAFALMLVVVVMTHDPFLLVNKVLEFANGFSVSLAAKVTGSANDTTITAGQALVDNSIRTPTLALNYGQELSDTCKAAWSQAMISGNELTEASGCFNKGQNDAGPDTVITAIVMLIFPAIPMFAFSVIAAWKYVIHLSMSVMCTVSTAWVAAASIHKRRGFETLSKQFSLAIAHLAMAVVTSMVAVALPTLCAGLATQLLGLITSGEAQAFVMMFSLGIGFMVSTWIILRVTSRTGVLVRLLDADVRSTLDKTIGMNTTKFSNVWKINNFSSLKFNPFAEEGDAKKPAGDNKPARSSAPARAAGAAAVGSAAGSTKKKESPTVRNQPSAEEEAAVEQLAASAVSVAEAANEPKAERAVMMVKSDSIENPDSRTWQQTVGAAAPAAAAMVGDPFGHYFRQPEGTETAAPQPFVVTTAAAEPATAPVADATASQSPAANPLTTGESRITERPEQPQPAASTDPAQPLTPGVTEPAQQSYLTNSRAMAPQPPHEQPLVDMPAPVKGNLFADPALDDAAREAGATFTTTGPFAAVKRVKAAVLRPFKAAPIQEPVPFAEPRITHGPAIEVSVPDTVDTSVANAEPGGAASAASAAETAAASAANATAGAPANRQADPEATDQKLWNIRAQARRMQRWAKDKAKGAPAQPAQPEIELAKSGLGPGVNRHPASFQAPLEDHLASAAFEAGIDETRTTLGAAGHPVAVRIPANDTRIALSLSSDPDERVVRASGRGFGDPV